GIFIFFFHCFGVFRDVHSFPTRRSSDLITGFLYCRCRAKLGCACNAERFCRLTANSKPSGQKAACSMLTGRWPSLRKRSRGLLRSEEHTSELQSPCNLVCRLLLEKQKVL